MEGDLRHSEGGDSPDVEGIYLTEQGPVIIIEHRCCAVREYSRNHTDPLIRISIDGKPFMQ